MRSISGLLDEKRIEDLVSLAKGHQDEKGWRSKDLLLVLTENHNEWRSTPYMKRQQSKDSSLHEISTYFKVNNVERRTLKCTACNSYSWHTFGRNSQHGVRFEVVGGSGCDLSLFLHRFIAIHG